MTHPEESVQTDGYRWVMLTLFVLMSLFIWSAWFAQAPLLETYWGKVFHIGAATGNLLLSLPGLVAIILGVSTGRWVRHRRHQETARYRRYLCPDRLRAAAAVHDLICNPGCFDHHRRLRLSAALRPVWVP